MKYKAYPKYKDSGVEWLGEVPDHWDVKRIKQIGSIRYGLGEPPEYVDNGLPFIRATDINRGKIDLDAVKKVNPKDIPWNRKPELKLNEILVVRSGAYTGDSAIVTEDIAGCIVGYDMVLTVRAAYPPFIAWVLLSKYMLQGQIYLERLRAAQPHLNAEELGSFIVLLPPNSQQQVITDFLASETNKIDTLLSKKRALIEKLKEKRTALISRTVTRGLPPEAARAAGLDPHPKLKPSGVEWLGDVPEHWRLKRIKQIGSIRYGLGEPPEYVDNGLPFIRATDINRGKIDLEAVKKVNPEDIPLNRNPVLKLNEILVVRSGAYTGDSALVTEHVAGSIVGYDMVLTIHAAYPRFMSWVLLSKYMLEGQIYTERLRAAQPHLNAEELGGFIVLLPPISQQHIISDYLEQETTIIDKLINKVEAAIDRLQEYRTALITAAVTGKIDVRAEAGECSWTNTVHKLTQTSTDGQCRTGNHRE